MEYTNEPPAVSTNAGLLLDKTTEKCTAESSVPFAKTAHHTNDHTSSAQSGTTTINIEGRGKIALSLTKANRDDSADEGPVQMVIESKSPTTVSLTLPSHYHVEKSQSEGEFVTTILKDVETAQKKSPDTSNDTKETRPEYSRPTFTKSHRRNNSAHLFISGVLKPSDDVYSEAMDDIDSVDENSDAFNEIEEYNIKEVLDKDEKYVFDESPRDELDARFRGPSVGNLGKELTTQSKVLASVTAAFSVLGESLGKSLTLARRIQQNLPRLLDQTILDPLCDHLYSNTVLSIHKYEAILDALRHGRPTRDCIRDLFLYLSRVPVNEQELRKSLEDSNQAHIIPLILWE